MNPLDVDSPKPKTGKPGIEPGSIHVIITREAETPGKTWSMAEMMRGGRRRIGVRWDGDPNDPDDLGHPSVHGNATWFVLPDAIGIPIADLFLRCLRD
jgi:hypothetical protein